MNPAGETSGIFCHRDYFHKMAPLRCSDSNVPQCFVEVKKDVQLQSHLVTMDSNFRKTGLVALSLWEMETVSGSTSKQQMRPVREPKPDVSTCCSCYSVELHLYT